MWYKDIINKKMKSLVVEDFLDDPEGDPYRGGDGLYYQFAGEKGWSGAWWTEAEARAMAKSELKDRYAPIERKRAFFNADMPSGFMAYLATGTSTRSELFNYAIDPYSIFWSSRNRTRQGLRKFSMLIPGRSPEEAARNVRARVGEEAVFKIKIVYGDLAQICVTNGLTDPADLIRRAEGLESIGISRLQPN